MNKDTKENIKASFLILVFIAVGFAVAKVTNFWDSGTTETPVSQITAPLAPVETLKQAKLDYLWSKVSDKDRCRIEQPYLYPDYYQTVFIGYEEETFVVFCHKWLDKTESVYVNP